LEVETTYNLNLKMKYIITESRLDNVIFNYLDIKLNGIEKRKSINNYDVLFILPEQEFAMLGWKGPGDLFVLYTLIDDIQNIFTLERDESLDVIGKYVKDRYKLKVTNPMEVGLMYSMILKIDRD
jgi:hypothetical protein